MLVMSKTISASMKSVFTGPDSSSQLSKFLKRHKSREENFLQEFQGASVQTHIALSLCDQESDKEESRLSMKTTVLVEGRGGCPGVRAAHRPGFC